MRMAKLPDLIERMEDAVDSDLGSLNIFIKGKNPLSMDTLQLYDFIFEWAESIFKERNVMQGSVEVDSLLDVKEDNPTSKPSRNAQAAYLDSTDNKGRSPSQGSVDFDGYRNNTVGRASSNGRDIEEMRNQILKTKL